MQKKNLKLDNKGFAVTAIIFGIIGLLLMTHHIASYDAILRPYLYDGTVNLIENQIITNDISGITFLRMFTNESNILVDLWLIFFGLGIFGVKPLYNLTHKEGLRSCITLNIAVTGIIYFTVLLPNSSSFPNVGEPWIGSLNTMAFSNVINTWNHLITPVFFTAVWFFAVENKKYAKVKYSLYNLIYPICYFIMCIILGAIDGFYPYPFLNGQQMWGFLFKDKPYNSLIGTLLLVAVVVILSGVFFGISCGLIAIHNKRVEKTAE